MKKTLMVLAGALTFALVGSSGCAARVQKTYMDRWADQDKQRADEEAAEEAAKAQFDKWRAAGGTPAPAAAPANTSNASATTNEDEDDDYSEPGRTVRSTRTSTPSRAITPPEEEEDDYDDDEAIY